LASHKDKVSISLVRETMYRYEFIQKERAVVGELAEREGEAAQKQLRYLVAML